MNIVAADSTANLRILGYSNCVGEERNNKFLRRGRALRVHRLLYELLARDPRWSVLRSRIVFVGAAPAGEYVADNGTVEGRAKNRGVIIELRRSVSFTPEPPITGRPCKEQVIDKAMDLVRPDRQLFDAEQGK